MKKLLLLASVTLGVILSAQEYGIKAGAQFSLLGGEAFQESKSNTGFYVGAFLRTPVADRVTLQPEIIYQRMGGNVQYFNSETLSYIQDSDLDYISIPLMFQYNITPSVYLELGPQFSYLVNEITKLEAVNPIPTEDNIILDPKLENFSKFDFSVGIGAGYWITTQIGINARYNFGINNINDKNERVSLIDSDHIFRNNAFQVGLSYKF